MDFRFSMVGGGAYARATNVMSTQSETDFEWSVKLIGTGYFHVGIASQLRRAAKYSRSIHRREVFDISLYDRNAIIYYSNINSPIIRIGLNTIHSDLTPQNFGDIIRFRFQPKAKKLVIDLVRI